MLTQAVFDEFSFLEHKLSYALRVAKFAGSPRVQMWIRSQDLPEVWVDFAGIANFSLRLRHRDGDALSEVGRKRTGRLLIFSAYSFGVRPAIGGKGLADIDLVLCELSFAASADVSLVAIVWFPNEMRLELAD